MVDLASLEELEENLRRRRARQRSAQVAFLDRPVGLGHPWPTAVNWLDRYPLPFPATIAPEGFLMARLAADREMHRTLGDADIALLDISERARSGVDPEGVYVIERSGEAIVRYVRPGSAGYYLVTDASVNKPELWHRVRESRAEFLSQVRARILWVGREEARELPKDQRGRFLAAISL